MSDWDNSILNKDFVSIYFLPFFLYLQAKKIYRNNDHDGPLLLTWFDRTSIENTNFYFEILSFGSSDIKTLILQDIRGI